MRGRSVPTLAAAATLVTTIYACHARPGTPLAVAAAEGDSRAVERLVAAGADPSGRDDPREWTPIIWAARMGRPATIETLIRLGADPDLPAGRPGPWTPLLHAIHRNQLQVVETLLDHGANPNLGVYDGPTPLIMAAGYGCVPIVRTLLAHGADPRQRSGNITSLSAAVGGVPDIDRFTVGRCQTETVRLLVQAAPDVRLSENGPARWFAGWGNCTEVLSLVDAGAGAR